MNLDRVSRLMTNDQALVNCLFSHLSLILATLYNLSSGSLNLSTFAVAALIESPTGYQSAGLAKPALILSILLAPKHPVNAIRPELGMQGAIFVQNFLRISS